MYSNTELDQGAFWFSIPAEPGRMNQFKICIPVQDRNEAGTKMTDTGVRLTQACCRVEEIKNTFLKNYKTT